MAAKKKSAKKATRRRRPATKRASGRRRGSVTKAGFAPTLMQIGMGVAGAVIATKVIPMIPVGDNRIKFGIATAAGAFLAIKPGPMRALGMGMGIASGTMLLGEFMPNLMGPAPTATVGRLSPQTQRYMQQVANNVRRGINGYRQRTVVGTGEGGNFPQPVNGPRSRTIVGSGEQSFANDMID